MIFSSNVKVNIGLFIKSVRSDGYHNISTIFQELNIGDSIDIQKTNSQFMIKSNNDNVPLGKSNTCYKAFYLLKKLYPKKIKGLSINLIKKIPPGTGLGAGSSNGATILKAISQIYELNINYKKLERLAATFSADAPFFIRGKTQIGSGIGDILKNISKPFHGPFLIVIPKFKIKTKWAFEKLKNQLNNKYTNHNIDSVLDKKNLSKNTKLFENDFERIVIPTYPEIGNIKNKLIELGAIYSSLSGTGSTVFGVFNDESSAKEAELFFQNKHLTYLTYPI